MSNRALTSVDVVPLRTDHPDATLGVADEGGMGLPALLEDHSRRVRIFVGQCEIVGEFVVFLILSTELGDDQLGNQTDACVLLGNLVVPESLLNDATIGREDNMVSQSGDEYARNQPHTRRCELTITWRASSSRSPAP